MNCVHIYPTRIMYQVQLYHCIWWLESRLCLINIYIHVCTSYSANWNPVIIMCVLSGFHVTCMYKGLSKGLWANAIKLI